LATKTAHRRGVADIQVKGISNGDTAKLREPKHVRTSRGTDSK